MLLTVTVHISSCEFSVVTNTSSCEKEIKTDTAFRRIYCIWWHESRIAIRPLWTNQFDLPASAIKSMEIWCVQ